MQYTQSGFLSCRGDFTVDVMFELSGISRGVDFYMGNFLNSNPVSSITYFNAGGVLIGTKNLPLMPQPSFQTVSFVAPVGEFVASFRWRRGVLPPNEILPGRVDYIRWYA